MAGASTAAAVGMALAAAVAAAAGIASAAAVADIYSGAGAAAGTSSAAAVGAGTAEAVASAAGTSAAAAIQAPRSGDGAAAGSATAAAVGAATAAAVAGASGAATAEAAGNALSYDKWNSADKATGITLSGGDLIATLASGSGSRGVRSVGSKSTGKWHFEITATSGGGANPDFAVGIANATKDLTQGPGTGANAIIATESGAVVTNGSSVGSCGQYINGSVLAVEIDADAKTIQFYSSANPGWSAAFDYSGVTGDVFVYFAGDTTGYAATLNTGGGAFSISPSSGYSAWG